MLLYYMVLYKVNNFLMQQRPSLHSLQNGFGKTMGYVTTIPKSEMYDIYRGKG